MKITWKSRVVAAAAALVLAVATSPAATVYNINFTSNDEVPNGFTNYKPTNFNALEAETFSIGNGLTLSFDLINNYTTTNTTINPLTAGGLFAPIGVTSNFQLSGLTPGSTVTLYAIGAWDGPGRAAFVSFAGSGLVDTAGNPPAGDQPAIPGFNPTTADFKLINMDALVGGSGILFGTVDSGGRIEGQLGGFIISVNAVPEPSTWAMLVAGAGTMLVVVARRRKLATI